MQCADLEGLLSSASGKQFNSTTHMLLKDRERLYLTELQSDRFERYYLDTPGELSSLPFPMDAEIIEREQLKEIPSDPKVACLDYEKIQFPLTVRHWLHGDYFIPLGMDQLKKVSNFFIDLKIPIPLKNRIWILASGKKIVWIMGLRIDDRFKISSSTKKILKLKIYDSETSPG
jgi:tRNA(Ile)-lysidine synthase